MAAPANTQKLTLQQKADMEEKKKTIKLGHKEYIEQHPELKQIISDFLSDCLVRKPDDVYAFAFSYFSTFSPDTKADS